MHYETQESWGSNYMYERTSVGTNPLDGLERIVRESAVVIFSKSTCCMCHAMKRLFCGMGVNPTVYELDDHTLGNGHQIEKALMAIMGINFSNYNTYSLLPVVFIGGKLVGSMDRVMASHINGSLVPLLKDAGALWL